MTLLGNRDTRDNVILTGIAAALLTNYQPVSYTHLTLPTSDLV